MRGEFITTIIENIDEKIIRINILLFLKYRLNKIIIYYAIEGGGQVANYYLDWF